MMKTKRKKRSPLRDKPLRYAGQSLDEQIEDEAFRALYWILMSGLTFTLAFIDWARFLYPQPSTKPWLITIITIIVIVTTIIIIYKTTKKVKRLRLGRDGEKIVAEHLQTLQKNGAAILNDIIGPSFNVDHVIISSKGIYVVETKTFSKPIGENSKITMNNGEVFADGYKVDRNPVRQAQALANWIRELVEKSTGLKFFVKPVVLFPGWFVEKMSGDKSVWVLNPKALPVFISNEPRRMKDTDVHLVTYHLSQYVRAYKEDKK